MSSSFSIPELEAPASPDLIPPSHDDDEWSEPENLVIDIEHAPRIIPVLPDECQISAVVYDNVDFCTTPAVEKCHTTAVVEPHGDTGMFVLCLYKIVINFVARLINLAGGLRTSLD